MILLESYNFKHVEPDALPDLEIYKINDECHIYVRKANGEDIVIARSKIDHLGVLRTIINFPILQSYNYDFHGSISEGIKKTLKHLFIFVCGYTIPRTAGHPSVVRTPEFDIELNNNSGEAWSFDGYNLKIHTEETCAGNQCFFHKPTDHAVSTWTLGIADGFRIYRKDPAEQGNYWIDPDQAYYLDLIGEEYDTMLAPNEVIEFHA
jgi:hypothetical protein